MEFSVDAPRDRVIRTFEFLGFRVVGTGNHLSMAKYNEDGTVTPLTMPGHSNLKSSALRAIFTQAALPRDSFLRAYEEV